MQPNISPSVCLSVYTYLSVHMISLGSSSLSVDFMNELWFCYIDWLILTLMKTREYPFRMIEIWSLEEDVSQTL